MGGARLKHSMSRRTGLGRIASMAFLVFGLIAVTGVRPILADEVEGTAAGLSLVVLADESGSLKQAGVQAEVAAVSSLLARRELSGETPVEIGVIGFGSGDKATDVKCPLARITGENVTQFIDCAGKIGLRTTPGTRDTDFAKALTAAADMLAASSEEGNGRAIILMTDGKYDPSGNRDASGLASDEVAALETAKARMAAEGIQVWPLGFGNVIEDELEGLAVSGAAAQCQAGSAKPYATTASKESLGEYLLVILNSTLCIGSKPAQTIPADVFVHPLVDQVTLTVRGASLDPSVRDGSGAEVCVNSWLKAADDSLACRVDAEGGSAGTWVITTSEESSTGSKPTVEASFEGRVDLALENCTGENPLLKVSRTDGTEANWDLEGVESWPNLIVESPRGSETIEAVSDVIPLDPTTLRGGEGAAAVVLGPDQPDFIWLTASTDSCELASSITPSSTAGDTDVTSSSDVTTPTTSTPTENKALEEKSGGSSLLLWMLLLIFIIVAALFVLRRMRKRSYFPGGAEVQQRGGGGNWMLRIDLGGRREVGIAVDPGGWIVEQDDADASLLVIRKSSRPDLGDFIIIDRSAGLAADGDAQGLTETYHSFSSEIVAGGARFRVEVPEEVEDEFEDE